MNLLICGIYWTELNKKSRDRLRESRMTAMGGGIDQKGKRTDGHGQAWWLCGGGGMREIHGNRKSTLNIKI